MKKIVFLTFVLSIICLAGLSQNITLLEIDGNKISADEFMYIYKKSAVNNAPTDYQSLKDYLDLFINFKLKVHDATVLGYDTLSTFKNELSGYRNQLAQPYLTDKKVEEDVLNEVYDRMKRDVRVAHILVKSSALDAPADTLKAYNRVNKIYEKLQNGEDFANLSSKYSDDEYFKSRGGDLGYYNVFSLVYEFETVMYETPVGGFSKPFKTAFGYHILKVLDSRPAKGKYKVAHIMKIIEQSANGPDKKSEENSENAIKSILKKLDNGEDFEQLARVNSDDTRTAVNGGVFGWVSVGGKVIRDFEDAVFSLNEPGDIYRTLKTNYGFHIIKLLEKEELKPFEELKHEIKQNVSNNARSSKSREAVIKRLKQEYNFVKYPENVAEITAVFKDTSLYNNWETNASLDFSKPVFSFADKSYSQKEFMQHLANTNILESNMNFEVFVNRNLSGYIDNKIVEYENTVLETKYPDFKYIMNEYHDGILLFEITDKFVWSKSISDQQGLNEFYENNKANYFWNDRIDYKVFKCKDVKISRKLFKAISKNKDEQKTLAKLNKKDSSAVILHIDKRFERESASNATSVLYGKELPSEKKKVVIDASADNDEFTLTLIKDIGNVQKELKDARGIITADYQNKLEKDWIDELHKKYSVSLNEEVLKSLVK